MKRVLRIGSTLIVAVSRIAYLLPAIGLILLTAYVIGGHSYLVKGASGTDTANAISMLVWIDKYFPRVPFWYPLAGGGVSITHGYPVFSFYLVALLKRLTDLNLFQAFRVLGFSSVVAMALGIYAFAALRLKNQTVALIAAIFYLISPIAWTWLLHWGFYAEAVSHMFVMPAIIFWDLFFGSFCNRGVAVRSPRNTSEVSADFTSEVGESASAVVSSRIYLALTIIFLSLTTLTHFGTGLAVMAFFGFYLIGYFIRNRDRRKTVIRGAMALALVCGLTILATAFTTFPFSRYGKIAAQAGLSGGWSLEQFKENEVPLKKFLGFDPFVKGDFIFAHRNISFPAILSIFVILGAVLSFTSARTLTLALYAAIVLILSAQSDLPFWISEHFPVPIAASFSKRFSFVLLRFILPTLGAYGAVAIFSVPFFWIKNRAIKFIKNLLASLAGLALVAFVFLQFITIPSVPYTPNKLSEIGTWKLDLRDIWKIPGKACFSEESCVKAKEDICLEEKKCAGGAECLEKLDKKFADSGYSYEMWCHSSLRYYFSPHAVKRWCLEVEELKSKEELPEEYKDEGLGPLLNAPLPNLCDPQNLNQEKIEAYWNQCRQQENLPGYSLCRLRYKTIPEQFSPDHRPALTIADSFGHRDSPLNETLEEISQDSPAARIDFSPGASDRSIIAPFYNLDRGLSQLHTYASSVSLIRRLQGWQQDVFYLNKPEYRNPNLINDLARWFEINYVFFGGQTDSSVFKEAGWEVFEGSWKSGVLKFPEENRLVELSDKAAVLVIGQNKAQAYDHVLTAAPGVLPYEKAFLVWGKERLDAYRLEELRGFDVLILHGYTYKSRSKADRLLNDYLAGGGRVFIDTGWQYTVPDWEAEETLDVIPLASLSWVDDPGAGYSLEDSGFGDGVNLAEFGPLVYDSRPWGISTSDRGNLKDGARVALSLKKDGPLKDRPLIVAGEVGEGRVVWSGMSSFYHVNHFKESSQGEVKLLANLFDWLIEGTGGQEFDVSYVRNHPDEVEFAADENVSDGNYLLWKEIWHPDFHAYLGEKELSVYRAGPGMTLIKVPDLRAGDRIIYKYEKPFSEKTALALSIITYLLLPLLILESVVFKQGPTQKLFGSLEEKVSHLFSLKWRKKVGSWWEKEEEY